MNLRFASAAFLMAASYGLLPQPGQAEDLRISTVHEAPYCTQNDYSAAKCISLLRDAEKLPFAIAVGVVGEGLKSTVLQARPAGAGATFRSIPYKSGDVPTGSGVIWQFRPDPVAAIWSQTADELGESGFEARIRIISETKGSKNCPTVQFRKPGDTWEFYDSNKKVWVELPDPTKASFTALQYSVFVPLRGLKCN